MIFYASTEVIKVLNIVDCKVPHNFDSYYDRRLKVYVRKNKDGK